MRATAILLLLLAAASSATATPGASTWYRESLLGENGSHYFVLESRWINTGTYYGHTEFQRIVMRSKYTDAIEDTVLVRKTVFTTDAGTGERSVTEEATPSFDLAAYVRAHSIQMPFGMELHPVPRLDGSGLFQLYEDGRVDILSIEQIRERIPPGGEIERLEFLGAEFTSATPDSGLRPMSYYRISSFPAGSDVDGSEIIIRAHRPW